MHRRFRYFADPVCAFALIAFAVNRFWLKPQGISGTFGQWYLNDVLCLPLFLPMILWLQRRMGLREHDGPPRAWEVLQHWAIFSILFEVILPHFPQYFLTAADPWDVVAYWVGGMGAWMWWNRRRLCLSLDAHELHWPFNLIDTPGIAGPDQHLPTRGGSQDFVAELINGR